jgi:L,D-transpeptidase-like protein
MVPAWRRIVTDSRRLRLTPKLPFLLHLGRAIGRLCRMIPWLKRTKTVLGVLCLIAFVAAAYAHWPVGDPPKETVDRILVLKSEHRMLLFRTSRELKSYSISLGRNPVGPKTRAGDHRTPEGRYVVDWRNPKSKFHLSLHISYPNAHDVALAGREGVQPGGDIMIHGLQNGLGWLGRLHRFMDWTDGCIAVTDAEMDQIWGAVPDGTPIEIRP